MTLCPTYRVVPNQDGCHITEPSKYKNIYTSVNFTDIELIFDVVVAERHHQHLPVLQVIINHSIALPKALALTVNKLLAKYVVNHWTEISEILKVLNVFAFN